METAVSPAIFAIYFSGFSAHAIEYKGTLYPTVEHAYHCLRYADTEIIERILKAKSPEIAWELSQTYKPQRAVLTDEQKLALMESLIRSKVEQHADVRAKLIETGDALIIKKIQSGPPGDGFWDIGEDDQGQNHVGKIWMRIREELKA